MFPHERSLVARLKDQPFVILGVTSDPKEKLRAVIQREKMTWRSWCNGEDEKTMISAQWNVTGWPTLYLLDHHGVIHRKWVGAPDEAELNAAVDRLLTKTESTGEAKR